MFGGSDGSFADFTQWMAQPVGEDSQISRGQLLGSALMQAGDAFGRNGRRGANFPAQALLGMQKLFQRQALLGQQLPPATPPSMPSGPMGMPSAPFMTQTMG